MLLLPMLAMYNVALEIIISYQYNQIHSKFNPKLDNYK